MDEVWDRIYLQALVPKGCKDAATLKDVCLALMEMKAGEAEKKERERAALNEAPEILSRL